MPTLASDLRNRLERVVIEARDVAEAGAQAALEAVAVHEPKFYPHMPKQQQELRNHLRARARQLGDQQDSAGRLAIDHLAGECAYEHWHRMLFARFLAENGLLIEPQENMAISLAEAEELAKEEGEDVWVFASRCAQRMLPQIFRPDDPLLGVSFAKEHMLKLETLLASLPQAVFTASDAMGWVYQYWQSKKKDEVNRSEVKIGADEISAVTQLFTEPYMVEFLLHNTLGAWWAGKQLRIADCGLRIESEADARRAVSLPGIQWEYLRFIRKAAASSNPQSAIRNPQSQWRPAAGTFDGWPKTAAELKVLDPCCGSGHFLVAALHHLVPIRMAEESLSAAEAVDAVLRDNLHGLEIDERCCQIAAFALAFEAWKMAGYRPLPALHIACTGIGPQSTEEQWVKLAEESGIRMPVVGREAIKNGLLNLHRLFSQAPTLGSLINPAELPADLIAADYETIQPYLAAILKTEKADDETRERAIAAAGMVRAADLLAGEYTLVITNVPYLGRAKQDDVTRIHLEGHFNEGKSDLAAAFVMRCMEMCAIYGSVGIVTPQTLLFLKSFEAMRVRLLKQFTWNTIAWLGEHAFESTAAAGAFAAMEVLTASRPGPDHAISCLDVSAPLGSTATSAFEKATMLRGAKSTKINVIRQARQLANPDAKIMPLLGSDLPLLGELAFSSQGIKTGDDGRVSRSFWELNSVGKDLWRYYHSTVEQTQTFGGMSQLILWKDDGYHLARRQGTQAWGMGGVMVSQMRGLPVALYLGDVFDSNGSPIIPRSPGLMPALWAFCSSESYCLEVRKVDHSLKPTNTSLVQVPFDFAHWQKVAAAKYPEGLPEPESDDPTQWLFHGRPEEAAEGHELQVAVARLLGYRWPAELDPDMRLSKRARALVKRCGELAKFADDDGIVCIPSVRGEEPAADRLLALLGACGLEFDGDPEDWLRNDFFEQHCKLFHDRPFVWHIWDGRKRDGFGALVNYHKLCEGSGKGRKLLESLTYSYLGDWITRQRDGVKHGEEGAEDRLAAALELQNRLKDILAGEPPFDIFVRWKPLAEQPIGWEPDINDGVRMNIRPFLASDLPTGRTGAGVLRWKPNIKWAKDRGKEPDRDRAEYPWFWGWDEKTVDFAGGKEFDGNRHNDCHYTNKFKQAARDAAEKERKGS